MIKEKEISVFNPKILHLLREQKKANEWRDLASDYETVQKILEPSERFISERIQKVQEIMKPLSGKKDNKQYFYNIVDSCMCLHLVPIIDIISKPHLQVSEIFSKYESIHLFGNASPVYQTNIDGYQATYTNRLHFNYTKIFRNYCIESVLNRIIYTPSNSVGEYQPKKLFNPEHTTKILRDTIESHLRLLCEFNVNPPILLQISFLGMKSVSMYHKDVNFQIIANYSYSENELFLPASLISECKDDDHISNVLTEQLNYLWNAFGLKKCYFLDENGKLKI